MKINSVLAFAFFFAASSSSSAADIKKGNSFERCNLQGCSEQVSRKYLLETLPLESDLVIGETFFLSADLPTLYKTSFKPLTIVSVYDPRTGAAFKEGVDFKVASQGIEILPNSTMKPAPPGLMAPSEKDIASLGVKVSSQITSYQYAITYKKDEYYKVKTIGFLSKVKPTGKDKKIRVTFVGDVISDESETALLTSTEPQPGYAELVMSRLESLHPGKFLYRNNSVPDMTSQQAAWWVESKLNDQPSDVVVLALGMSDSNKITPENFRANLSVIIESVRKKNPNTAFILLSPMRPIAGSKIHHPEYFNKYVGVMKDLAIDKPNVKAVDFTAVWDRISNNKHFYDLTANGLHHPNDYVHRVMAETVLPSINSL